jgi:ABC-type Fe3+/spermidine/putrescine transport system ATPase subunit
MMLQGPTTTVSEKPKNTSGDFIGISGVSKFFGGVCALDSVDLKIPEGSFFSLLGPSGCGKTTLLRILSGFEKPDAGDVTLDGENIVPVPAERRPFNIVFQRYALFPHMTVAENVAFGLTTGGRGRGRESRATIAGRVSEMLSLVELVGFDKRYPSQLSGGQAQRVALARALINRPRLLLLDEPLSALDQNVRKVMREHLLRIHQGLGITFLLVSHDQEEALSMSTHVALMNRGKIVQIGDAEDLYRRPQSLFAAHFIGEGSFLEGLCVRAAGGQAEIHVGNLQLLCVDGGCRAGQRAEVLIRPEECEVVVSGGMFSGVIATCAFLGSHYEVTVSTSFGTVRLRANAPLRVGELVQLRLSANAGVSFGVDE